MANFTPKLDKNIYKKVFKKLHIGVKNKDRLNFFFEAFLSCPNAFINHGNITKGVRKEVQKNQGSIHGKNPLNFFRFKIMRFAYIEIKMKNFLQNVI